MDGSSQQPENQTVNNGVNKKQRQKMVLIVVAVVVIILISIFVALQNNSNQAVQSPETSSEINSEASQQEDEDLIKKVSELIKLPAGEPTVITIDNKDEYNSLSVFADVENGDKALIFIDSNWAIIYRPSTNQIINADTFEIVDEEETDPNAIIE